MTDGWIGDTKAVAKVLAESGADQDQDGAYLVRGPRIIFGLGGLEAIVPTETEVSVSGEWKNLVAMLPAEQPIVRVY